MNPKVHLNSANNIRCASDANSFLYDQFAGSISCGGTAVAKAYTKVCLQGMPPTLYDLAVNLACCSGYNTTGCTKGLPAVISTSTKNNLAYKNGVMCANQTRTSSGGHLDRGASSSAVALAVVVALISASSWLGARVSNI